MCARPSFLLRFSSSQVKLEHGLEETLFIANTSHSALLSLGRICVRHTHTAVSLSLFVDDDVVVDL